MKICSHEARAFLKTTNTDEAAPLDFGINAVMGAFQLGARDEEKIDKR